MDESAEIPEEHWNQALVLYKLVVDTHRSLALKVVDRYAYHFESGLFFELGDVKEMAMTWKYELNGEYEVRFVDCADHILLSKGFCVVTSDKHCPLSQKFGYKHAKCSCAEYLSRRHMPCCHVLVLYLLVCTTHDQAELAKLRGAALTQLIDAQKARERNPKLAGHRFVNGLDHGREFVHTVVSGADDRFETLKAAVSEAHAVVSIINSKSKKSQFDTVVSPEIMNFIQCSPGDFIRNKVIRKCANGAFVPLPPRKLKAKRGPKRVSFAKKSKESPIDKSAKIPSAKRRRDAKDKRSGKKLASDDVKEFYSNPTGRTRTRPTRYNL
jgi:hypothetical protein